MTPEEVVRAFLQAEASWFGAEEFACGELRRLQEQLSRFNELANATVEHSTVNVKRLRVSSEDGGSALVELHAIVLIDGRSVAGRSQMHWRFTGPVRMRKVEGMWRVESIVVDRIRQPEGTYRGGGDAFIAQLLPQSSVVIASLPPFDESVDVEDFTVTFRAWRLIDAKYASGRAPQRVEAGTRYFDSVLVPASSRTPLHAVLTTSAGVFRATLEPPRVELPLRRRLRPVYGPEGLCYAFASCCLVNGVVSGGWGFLGIALAVAGSLHLVRGVALLLAQLVSPWARFLAGIGAGQALTGLALMHQGGFSWLEGGAVVGTIVFAGHKQLEASRAAGLQRRRARAAFESA